MIAALTRLRQRAADRTDDADGGFMLIYVLGIAFLVTILATTAVTVTTSNIRPTQQAVYANAASAAAQAGINAYVARLQQAGEANPGSSTDSGDCQRVSPCSVVGQSLAAALAAGDGNSTQNPCPGTPTADEQWPERYSAGYATSSLLVGDLIRVTSKGCAGLKGMHSTRTLVADIAGGADLDPLHYAVITKYETQAASVVAQDYPQRSIELTDPAISRLANRVSPSITSGATVNWGGAKATGDPGANANLSVDTCNTLWYQEGSTPGRATVESNRSMPPYQYVDWGENGSVSGHTLDGPSLLPCQVSLGSGSEFYGDSDPLHRYYTKDALLLSQSTQDGTGPLLDMKVESRWGANDTPAAPGSNYRSFDLDPSAPAVGGHPRAGSTEPTVDHAQFDLDPPAAAPAVPTDACVYQGPTRILMNADGSATITSPLTTAPIAASPSACYGGGAIASGMVAVTVPDFANVSNGLAYVQNKGVSPGLTDTAKATATGWAKTGQRTADAPTNANTVFYLPSTAGAATASTPGSVASAYTADWPSNAKRVKCNGAAVTDQQTFTCDWSGTSGANYPPGGSATTDATDQFAAFKACLGASLANPSAVATAGGSGCAAASTIDTANSPGSASPTGGNSSTWAVDMKALVNAEVRRANTSGHPASYSGAVAGDRQYVVVSQSTTATGTGSAVAVGSAPSPATSDPLFGQQAGAPATQTPSTTTTTLGVGRQVYGCYVPPDASIIGLLATILGALGLSAIPGQYDSSGKLCGTVSFLGLGSSPGPGVWTWGSGGTGTVSSQYGGSVAAFTVQLTQTQNTLTTPATPAVSYFPAGDDVTQYATASNAAGSAKNSQSGEVAPGDLYLQGTVDNAARPISFGAADDVVLTGSLTDPHDAGIAVVAGNNVRLYNPVRCRTAPGATTTTGFCPNDLTGLYSGVLPAAATPAAQYVNVLDPADPGDATLVPREFDGALYALGVADCANPNLQDRSGAAFCGGQIGADNSNRGSSRGRFTIVGSTTQVHHGALGTEWEVQNKPGQSRPYSGWQRTIRYHNLDDLDFAYLPTLFGSASHQQWHVVSTSTTTD